MTQYILAKIITALIVIESGGNVDAFREAEHAIGCMQITPIALEDANRVARLHEITEPEYMENDCWHFQRSVEMAAILLQHYCQRDRIGDDADLVEAAVMMWRHGPAGHRKEKDELDIDRIERARNICEFAPEVIVLDAVQRVWFVDVGGVL